jgi:alanyl-tRNA synthetase
MPSPSTPSRSSKQVRQSFLDFFAQRQHTVVHSASLVPASDPTLLFTNSGMVQFKDVFLGTGSRPYLRAVDSQKCMRVAGKHNDLDDVGRDDSHHTFFEMLGNWSFGDYYKAEAIPWAWQLLTEVWGLPRQNLWATCFEDEQGDIPRDDEAADLWRAQPGMDPSHILFFGRKHNFWEMADLGPCGPDSEVHIDRGPETCDRQHVPGHVCRVNGDCARFLELWNLVFIQYNRQSLTSLELLPKKHVDTGMGLERVVSVLQGSGISYATDLFQPLFRTVQRLLGHDDQQVRQLLTPYRVMADHARAAAFLIADGVVPGNTGRNYVCRMVIRRASRFGAKAGFLAPFQAHLARTVIEEYGEVYPELVRNQSAIERTVTEEEERFQRTVDTGVARLEALLAEVAAQGGGRLDGLRAFDLYATYGLPLEISRDIARERGLEVDDAGFRKAMETHRDASGSGAAGSAAPDETASHQHIFETLRNAGRLPPAGVGYDPYGSLETEGDVVALVDGGQLVDSLGDGRTGAIVLPRTSFYVAAGGQVSDTGRIVSNGNGHGPWTFVVEDMREPIAGLILHTGRVESGAVHAGDAARAMVDASRRWDIMRNHTATHLLHAGLRAVLGEHARQAGSLVAPDRLRFDFTHGQALTAEQTAQVQHLVTNAILENHRLTIVEKPRRQAEAEGAMALFGETYGDTVRTISIGGAPRFSYELCAGTHVPATGVIGAFVIVREESVGAGTRRIEALTGRQAQAHLERAGATLQQVADLLGTTPDRVHAQLEALLRERKALEARLEDLERSAARSRIADLPAERIGSAAVLIGVVPGCRADDLRQLSDPFRSQHPTHAVLLGSEVEGKPLLVASLSPDLAERGLSAVELVRAAAIAIGGGGGGRPTMAQAGGKDAQRLPQAIDLGRQWLESHLARQSG